MTMNLDPRILQALFGVSPTSNSNGQVQEYTDPTTGLTYSLARNFEEVGGDAAYRTGNLLPGQIVASTGQKNNLGYNLQNVYDTQGNFLREDDDGAGFGAFGDFVGEYMGPILAAFGTWGASTGFGGALGAAEGAGLSGMDLAADAAAGTGNHIGTAATNLGGAAPAAGTSWADWAANEVAGASTNPATASQLNTWASGSAIPGAGSAYPGSSMPSTPAPESGPSTPSTPSSAPPGTQGPGTPNPGGPNWSDWAQQQLREAATNPTTADRLTRWASSSQLPYNANSGGWLDWLTKGSNLARLAGAAAGAASSRDGVQTQSTEPWGPAQGWLKDLLGRAQAIGGEALDNPVGPRLGQAYNNLFGTVDAANANSGGWLDSMRSNASGANGYDRSNPRARRQNTTATAKPNLGWLAALGG